MTRGRPFPLPTRRFPPRSEAPPPVHRPLLHDRRAIGALALLTLVVLGAVFAPWLAPYDPLAVDPANQFAPPGAQHLFGTDLLGRDVFSRVLFGGRITLATGVVAVLIAFMPGTALGLLAGYFGRTADLLIMRFMDMLLSFPGIVLALTIVAMLGPGVANVTLAVGIAAIPAYTRLVRGNALTLRRALFVRAARSVGASHWRVMMRHVLPNILDSLIVFATVDVAWSILNSASLSFLGLGAQQPTPEWGAMLNEGRAYVFEAPWIGIGPGAILMLTILAINFLGDSLRDALDPRMRIV